MSRTLSIFCSSLGIPRNQAKDAQALYDSRASTYDDSHHPRFARHMVELANIQPGEEVLDLACGTGLATFPAAHAVGSTGFVLGVEISKEMFSEAFTKSLTEPKNVLLERHDITDLRNLKTVNEGDFDCIICCSALVLLENPVQVLEDWTKYLKPGGRLVVDVTHIQNTTSGVVFERVGRRMDRPLPWYRLNFSEPSSLQSALYRAGLINGEVTFMSQLSSSGPDGDESLKYYVQDVPNPIILREYEVSDADSVFDAQIDGTPMETLASPPDVRQRAKELFREEWAKAADADGKVREVDGIFVGVGYKPKPL